MSASLADTVEVRETVYPDGVKACANCKQIKPVADFNRYRDATGWCVYMRRSSYCRACKRVSARESYRSVGRFRRLTKAAPVTGLPSQAPKREPVGAVAICVCSALMRCHAKDGKGGCEATGCSAYFEKGC